MGMLHIVRNELQDMINWYIGSQHGFDLSTGKDGKYFKRYLPPDLYKQYTKTYSGSDYNEIWKSIEIMCDLFHDLASQVALNFNFSYRQEEEDGIREYLDMVKNT